MPTESLISVKDLHTKHSIPIPTINHYTNIGLLQVIAKKGNVRLYNEHKAVETINRVQEMKNKGYTLRLIQQELLNLNHS